MNDKNHIFNDLKAILKESPITPQQKVVPIKESVLKEEKAFTLYIPKENIRRLKIISAELEITLKDMINEAINERWLKAK